MTMENRLRAAEHTLQVLYRLLAQHGPIAVRHDQLFAGELLLNGNEAIVDAVYEQTLFHTTIFLNDVRIATRAVARGETTRALGTRAPDDIRQQVLARGQAFRGRTHTLGKDYVIVYEPLHDAAGARVGMVAAYRELVATR